MGGFFVSPDFREYMLNSYLPVLTVCKPTVQKLYKNYLHLSWVFATAFVSKATQAWNLNSFHYVLLQRQLGSSFTWLKTLRSLVVLVILLNFLTFGPHASALANWEEKVVPDNKSFSSQTISDEILALPSPKFGQPVGETYISTYFSKFHQGVDLPKPYGSPVQTIAGGSVVFAGWSSLGYGKMVIVRHQLGYESLYAHLSEILVREGDQLNSDSVIGLVGSTGVAFGNHLHLEIHVQGVPVNPLGIIK